MIKAPQRNPKASRQAAPQWQECLHMSPASDVAPNASQVVSPSWIRISGSGVVLTKCVAPGIRTGGTSMTNFSQGDARVKSSKPSPCKGFSIVHESETGIGHFGNASGGKVRFDRSDRTAELCTERWLVRMNATSARHVHCLNLSCFSCM